MYSPTISNEEISMMPLADFGGRILVVDTADTMAEAERILGGQGVLGVDTETRPAFTKGVSYDMALLQISTANTALLFRLQMQTLSPTIKRILENPAVLKIGAALRDDIKGLQRSQGRFKPSGFVDLQTTISQWGIEEKSVKKMAAITLGVKVSKAQRLSNWEARSLTPAQQLYAAIDAWVCREIYVTLQQHDTDQIKTR